MKSKFTFAFATLMLVLTLAVNPPKAHAAIDQYLNFPPRPGSAATSAVTVGYVVSLVSSLVVP
jgi:hypothetical protein